MTEYAAILSQGTFSGVDYFMKMTPRRLFRAASRITKALEKK